MSECNRCGGQKEGRSQNPTLLGLSACCSGYHWEEAHDSCWELPEEGRLATQQVPEVAHTWETSRLPAA